MAKDKVTELKGIVRNTKDSASTDGECDEVINLRFKDKSWRPVGTLKNVEGFDALGTYGYERLFVHTNEYRHLFGIRNSNLYWIGNISDSSVVTPFLANSTTHKQPQLIKENVSLDMNICQTGHLMVVIDDGLTYFLYRPYADRYDLVISDFNNQIDHRLMPYGNVEFMVDLERAEDGRPFIFSNKIESAGIQDAWNKQDAQDKLDEESAVMRDVIYKTQKCITTLNLFWGAFVVCTAAELYDGTFILMSQPALMLAPNMKSTAHFQGWNADLLANKYYIQNGNIYTLSHNAAYCGGAVAYKVPWLTQGNKSIVHDTRYGCTALHSQYWSVNGVETLQNLNLPDRPNKVDYDYDKDLVNDNDFEAQAIDTYRFYWDGDSTSHAKVGGYTYNSYSVMTNMTEELPLHATGDEYGDRTYCFHYANKLKYRINSIIPSEYKDVVRNVSVFITPQAQVLDLKKYADSYIYTENYTVEHSIHRMIAEFKYNLRPVDKITKELMDEMMMYKIGEINMDDFKESNIGKWIELKIEEGVLTNLLSQDRLVTDSVGRNSYDAKVAFPYNNRLHIADYVEELFHGWLLDHFFYSEGVGQFPGGQYNISSQSGSDKVGWIKVTIDENGTHRVVVRDILLPDRTSGSQTPLANSKQIRYLNPLLSYPDRNAKEMEIYISNGVSIPGQANTFHETYTLTAHDHINYAYYITPDLRPIDTRLTVTGSGGAASPAEVNSKEAYHNRMKASRTNNPIYFPNENTYSVGNGKIVGMAANEVVLATGQLGDAPLYVFCSDGVYGLFVDSSGQLTYNFARVISEYVCNNARGIFNIHGGVLFPTEKGYILLEGMQTRDVTDKVEGAPFNTADIPQIQTLTNHNQLVKLYDKISSEDFINFIKTCTGGYNFADKEVWLTNKSKGYSYVIDDNGTYFKRTDNGVQFVNDFPRTYLLDNDVVDGNRVSTLRNLMDEEKDTQQTMFLTRAIKNDTQEFKQTERLIIRGEFHVPAIEANNVRKVDLRTVNPIIPEKISVHEPQNVITVQQNTESSSNLIVPRKVFRNYIAVTDVESIEWLRDKDNNQITFTDNAGTLAAVQHLFNVGYMTDPSLGWQKMRASDSVEYMLTVNANSYDVHIKFSKSSVYATPWGASGRAVFYFFDGWEGTCSELLSILNGTTARGKVCFLTYDTTTSTTTNYGLYQFKMNSNGTINFQDTIIVANEMNVNSNYRFAYIYFNRTVTPPVNSLVDEERFMDSIPTSNEGCHNYIQHRVINNIGFTLSATKYNNLVNVAVGNNVLYLDDGKTQSVTFSATLAQAQTSVAYTTVLNNYNQGVYGRASVSQTKYTIPRNTYVRLYDSSNVYLHTIYYTGSGMATWLQLTNTTQYPAVTLSNKNTTCALTNGAFYHISIGFYDTVGGVSVYRSVNTTKKYTGTTGSLTLSAIYTDLNLITPTMFVDITDADKLSGYNLILKAESYMTVTYRYNGQTKTANIYIEANEFIDAATFVGKIESGSYKSWSTDELKAGCYLFGSYDNKKWALLGARERDGDFRDIGLIAYRTDCKYFRLLFVGQLADKSSIEYIEQIVSDRMYRTKIR